ncbi:zinc finger protein 395 isoform X2 [Protopterus annectens]|nr:zinc finger protein 395 isoform X2 [Protopterus annectens]XP_043917798.1 zinc finger protein 395 isoform X2 [Protopterus annectens]
MANSLTKRLGKRSVFGSRVDPLNTPGDGMLFPSHSVTQLESNGVLCYASDVRHNERVSKDNTGTVLPTRSKLYPGQKVYITYNGQELSGVVEQHNHVDDEVTVFVPQLGDRTCRKFEDVRLTEMQRPSVLCRHESHRPSNTTSVIVGPQNRSTSSNIDVPKRNEESVDMDEMMAAMVLTSLSCSPVVQSPPHTESGTTFQIPEGSWKESGDISDSGCSTASGHWSCGSASPTYTDGLPSEASGSPHRDDGFETDLDSVLFDEPGPRKRKNSMKVMYKCLWPSCGKLLRSIVGIKRHVRVQHLGLSPDSDQKKREEDFYYTEVQMSSERPFASTGSPSTTSPPVIFQQAPVKLDIQGSEHHVMDYPLTSLLSQSAPGSFWHIKTDHAYQAVVPIQIPVTHQIPAGFNWTVASAPVSDPSPVRSRSLSCSEPLQQQVTSPKSSIVASPPRAHSGSRKVRGEAKKCRKVYGIEHRDQWCTACRWKKACQRFLD